MEHQAVEALLRSGTQASEDGPIDELNAEQQLIGALDRAALRFTAILEDERRDEEGNFIIDLDMRLETFKLVRDWVAVRRRTKVEDPSASQTGVAEMQRRVQEGRTNLAPPPAPKKRGRPTKEEVAERDRLAALKREEEIKRHKNDDSGLAERLRAAQLAGARA